MADDECCIICSDGDYFNTHETDKFSVALCIWTPEAIEPKNFGHS